MSKRSILLLIVVILIIAGAYWFNQYFEKKHNKDVIILYGNVDVRQVDLGFQVLGRVEKMFFEEGDEVQPGALMGILDKRPYTDQVQQAEASLASVKANFENAERLLKRRQELVKDGSIAQEDLENAMASKLSLEANVDQAQAALEIANTNLVYTEVFAPTHGTILTRVREPGTVVTVGEPIYTLSITSPVWVRAFVAEPNLGQVYPGMPAEVFTDTPDGKVYKGYVGFISPVAEFTPKTVETTQLRTDLVYRLRIYAENPDHGLRQGMPVTVRLHLKN